jgi:hypothetical protein
MRVGRLVGWSLVAVALLMASADVVLAFVPGDHAGIAARDIYVLVAGKAVPPVSTVLAWPVWAFLGPLGMVVLWACRRRRRRYFRSAR